MYQLKNDLLKIQDHWMVNQALYQAVQETVPTITSYFASHGVNRMVKTPLSQFCEEVFPNIYTVPLFRKQFCEILIEEIKCMESAMLFQPNPDEDKLRQIPEVVLEEHCLELHRSMCFVVKNVLRPILISLWQRDCSDIASIQIANYNPKDKQKGAWHHDRSADISIVVPLNTNEYQGGGTEFHNHGVLSPLPSGHALIFPSFINLHRGLAVESGNRYLLVFWLHDDESLVENYETSFARARSMLN